MESRIFRGMRLPVFTEMIIHQKIWVFDTKLRLQRNKKITLQSGMARLLRLKVA
jgi:hypothetical protein